MEVITMQGKAVRPITMHDRIMAIEPAQARKYEKLSSTAQSIADAGIIRHLRACAKNSCNPDANAIREIIDDAINGRSVFSEN